MRTPRNIIITGATGGLGAALASVYAGPEQTLGLLGRDAAKLALLATACRDRGARVEEIVADVRDGPLLETSLLAFHERHPVDLILVNAGISPATSDTGVEAVEQVLASNVTGAINSVAPLIEPLRARRRGQIALVGSLGARAGLQSSPAYSMSKAALETYGFALRAVLAPDGVEVNVISPGFVLTPMSDRVMGKRPFLLDAERAARIIQRGLAANRARIAFPLPLALAAWLFTVLPPDIANRLQKGFTFRMRD